jgi:hypothetical protein
VHTGESEETTVAKKAELLGNSVHEWETDLGRGNPPPIHLENHTFGQTKSSFWRMLDLYTQCICLDQVQLIVCISPLKKGGHLEKMFFKYSSLSTHQVDTPKIV